jgi:hypothetical protein
VIFTIVSTVRRMSGTASQGLLRAMRAISSGLEMGMISHVRDSSSQAVRGRYGL